MTKILKDCPSGTPLFSPVYGEVKLKIAMDENMYNYPIIVEADDGNEVALDKYGRLYIRDGAECMLFPSRDCRDWSQFVPPMPEPKPKPKHIFQPFDKVLVRNSDNEWRIGFFDFEGGDIEHHHYYVIGSVYGFDQCLPYEGNEYLKGTTNKPKED